MNSNIKMFSTETLFCGIFLQTTFGIYFFFFFNITTSVLFQLIVVFSFGYMRETKVFVRFHDYSHVRFKKEVMFRPWIPGTYSSAPMRLSRTASSVYGTKSMQNTFGSLFWQRGERSLRKGWDGLVQLKTLTTTETQP